jgi:hypothetical protein
MVHSIKRRFRQRGRASTSERLEPDAFSPRSHCFQLGVLIACLVLPTRALLYLSTIKPVLLVNLQFLDGIGAASFGVMQLLMLSDLTRGRGHFSFAKVITRRTSASAESPWSWARSR